MRSGKTDYQLSQPGYNEKLLDRHSMTKAKTAKVPMQDIIFLPSNTPALELEKVRYAAKVGSIIYAMVET